MQLHYQNSIDAYFKNKCKAFKCEYKVNNFADNSPSFVDLKIIEFWGRFVRICPDGDCVFFCNKYMTEKRMVDFLDRVYAVRDKIDFKNYVFLDANKNKYTEEDLLEEFHRSRNIEYAQKFLKSSAGFGHTDVRVRRILFQVIEDCVADWLAMGCDVEDVSLMRAFELKKLFHLSDEAVELVLYLWLRDHPNMIFNVNARSGTPNFFYSLSAGSFRRVSLITGLDSVTLNEICSKESALVKFNLILMDDCSRNLESRNKQRELHLTNEVCDYLYGFSDVSRIIDFKPTIGSCISFAQISQTNQHAMFLLQILKYCKKDFPLNILFYGREGTGKTELAKALAQELNVLLFSIGVGDESMSREIILQTRLRSLLLADWECRQHGGIILMDEADLVLNKAEKGLLNTIFENLKTPVIWIANEIGNMEKSTRSRFDYSLEFFSFGKKERIAMWHSVLKQQCIDTLFCEEEVESIASDFPVMARGVSMATQLASRMQSANILPFNVAREVISSHAKLLDVSISSRELGEKYDKDYVRVLNGKTQNIDDVVSMLRIFDARWKGSKATGRREKLNIFLYGPPGTGKSAFAKHIAYDILGRDIIMKRASDILGRYVGESEHNVRAMFREAEQSDAILFVDEADSFFENRSNAKNHWEVTLVNEFICQMDSFNGMLIAATNYENVLDWAIRRRFQLKLAFGYMDLPQISKTWASFFGTHCPKEILRYENVSISDFQNVRRKLEYVPSDLRTKELILQNMLEELANKDDHQGRRLGL